MLSLPQDVFGLILDQLPSYSIGRLMQTAKQMNQAVAEWKRRRFSILIANQKDLSNEFIGTRHPLLDLYISYLRQIDGLNVFLILSSFYHDISVDDNIIKIAKYNTFPRGPRKKSMMERELGYPRGEISHELRKYCVNRRRQKK